MARRSLFWAVHHRSATPRELSLPFACTGGLLCLDSLVGGVARWEEGLLEFVTPGRCTKRDMLGLREHARRFRAAGTYSVVTGLRATQKRGYVCATRLACPAMRRFACTADADAVSSALVGSPWGAFRCFAFTPEFLSHRARRLRRPPRRLLLARGPRRLRRLRRLYPCRDRRSPCVPHRHRLRHRPCPRS